MTRAARLSLILGLAAGIGGCSGLTYNDCYVTSPEEYEAIPDSCDTVMVTAWPTDELELTSSDQNRVLSIGEVEGIEGSEPFTLRRIVATGFWAVYGEATEEAVLRDIAVPQVQTPNQTIAPRAYDEPCQMWAADSETGMALPAKPHHRVRLTSDVPLTCFNVSLARGRDGLLSGFDFWEDYSIEIEENARPKGVALLGGSASLRLEHLQELGSSLQRVELVKVNNELVEEYSAWLLASGFAGVLEVCALDETGLPESCVTRIPSSSPEGE